MNERAAYLRSELFELSAFLLLYVLICFSEAIIRLQFPGCYFEIHAFMRFLPLAVKKSGSALLSNGRRATPTRTRIPC